MCTLQIIEPGGCLLNAQGYSDMQLGVECEKSVTRTKSYEYILDIDSNTLDNRDDAIPFLHRLRDRMSQVSNTKNV